MCIKSAVDTAPWNNVINTGTINQLSLVPLFSSWGGVRLSPLGTSATNCPIVPAPDGRLWMWSSRWNQNWQGKPKYSEKTCPSTFFFDGSYSPYSAPGLFFSSVIIFDIVGRTPWTSDKPVGTPDPSVRVSEHSSCLRPRGHCDRSQYHFVHHKSHVTSLGIEPGPPPWEASD
jgi:hypothetical protein